MLVEVWRSNSSDAGSIPAISTSEHFRAEVLLSIFKLLRTDCDILRTYVLIAVRSLCEVWDA